MAHELAESLAGNIADNQGKADAESLDDFVGIHESLNSAWWVSPAGVYFQYLKFLPLTLRQALGERKELLRLEEPCAKRSSRGSTASPSPFFAPVRKTHP